MQRKSTRKTGTRFKTNPYGVKITVKRYNQYMRDIKKINEANNQRYEKVKNVMIRINGKNTDITVGQRINMTKPARGNILSNKYGTMQTALGSSFDYFKDKKSLESYIKNVSERAKPEALKKKQDQYKKNYLKTFRKVFGDEKSRINNRRARRLYNKLKSLDSEELEYIILTNERSDIQFQYSFEEMMNKLISLEYAFS